MLKVGEGGSEVKGLQYQAGGGGNSSIMVHETRR